MSASDKRYLWPRWASNFYFSTIEYDGSVYPTVEHAYQAHKAADRSLRGQFTTFGSIATPGSAKRAGQRIALRPDWEAVKETVMLDLLRIKFRDHASLHHQMVNWAEPLVEWNTWHDNYWGVCLCDQWPCPHGGLNRLGSMLTQVRRELIDGIGNPPATPANIPVVTVHR